jgi:RNA polymerase sigma-70 factor (ECF subfamily)
MEKSESNLPDLNELLRRAHGGDADALGRLLEAHRDSLRALAERQLRGRLASRVDASDVVQQAFLEAHRSFPEFPGQQTSDLAAWLVRIVDFAVAKAVRDHALLQKRDVRREQSLDDPGGPEPARRQELDAGHSTPSQRAMRSEDVERLTQALVALPDDQREAVRLRHLEGKSLDEIAQKLGRTPAATAGLIKRGMKTLRQHLRKND